MSIISEVTSRLEEAPENAACHFSEENPTSSEEVGGEPRPRARDSTVRCNQSDAARYSWMSWDAFERPGHVALSTLLAALTVHLQAQQPAWKGPSSHVSRLIPATQDVRLETSGRHKQGDVVR
jgi:hypothetical protein